MSNDVIHIDQALHGYRNGHRQIASSTSLSRDSQRIVLTLSDLSGTSITSGFESYVCGYPLEPEGKYALARTWYAPEMERPGCVWTHTLLISVSDLQSLSSAETLAGLFRRPETSNPSEGEYSEPIGVSSMIQRGRSWMSSNEGTAHLFSSTANQVLLALYDDEITSVVIPAQDSSIFEPLVMEIWSQQWPALRAKFTFCTGSLLPRQLGPKHFDLQVTPEKGKRQFMRKVQNGIVVDPFEPLHVASSWVNAVEKDLFPGSLGVFRNELWRLSQNIDTTRQGFGHLVRSLHEIEKVRSGDLPIGELVEGLATRFPGKKDADRLKKNALGSESTVGSRSSESGEFEILGALIRSRSSGSFDVGDLGICMRARRLWHDEPWAAQRLTADLVETTGSEVVKAVLDGFTREITPRVFAELINDFSLLLEPMLRERNSLAAHPDIWRANSRIWQQVLKVLAEERLTRRDIRDIVVSIVAAGSPPDPISLIGAFGAKMIPELLDAVADRRGDFQDLEPWSEVLEHHRELILSWLKASDNLIGRPAARLISRALGVEYISSIDPIGVDWKRLLQDATPETDPADVDIEAYLLAVALQLPPKVGDELIVSTLEIVYSALAEPRISTWAVDQLRYVLPSQWSSDPRRVKTSLGMAVVKRFLVDGWDPNLLIMSFKSVGTMRSVLQTLRRSAPNIFNRLKSLLLESENSIEDWQRRELRRTSDPRLRRPWVR